MKTSNKSFKILIALAVLSVAAMVSSLCLTGGREVEFTPPPFDADAVAGTPSVPDGFGYGEFWQEGMTYRFSVCGNVTADGTEATLYFTNSEGNEVWLKLRVLDKGGKILGETGLIKPGEYVEKVTLSGTFEAGTEIVLKVMGYEPETYYSAGSVSLRTKIGE
ncbi:MAG: hypothetical protein IJX55_08825 [Clostridia bacterium]|nr:hypothetical protein [Clostridia bacterium]